MKPSHTRRPHGRQRVIRLISQRGATEPLAHRDLTVTWRIHFGDNRGTVRAQQRFSCVNYLESKPVNGAGERGRRRLRTGHFAALGPESFREPPWRGASELISFSRPCRNPRVKAANRLGAGALRGVCQAGISVAGQLRPCHTEERETRRAGPIMIARLKYSHVQMSDMAPQDIFGVEGFFTGDADCDCPIVPGIFV